MPIFLNDLNGDFFWNLFILSKRIGILIMSTFFKDCLRTIAPNLLVPWGQFLIDIGRKWIKKIQSMCIESYSLDLRAILRNDLKADLAIDRKRIVLADYDAYGRLVIFAIKYSNHKYISNFQNNHSVCKISEKEQSVKWSGLHFYFFIWAHLILLVEAVIA